jgi:Transposase IS116/IS110/IS902 family
MSLRSVLRGFGLKIGKVVPTQSEARIPEPVEGHPSLKVIATSTLAVRATLRRESNGFGKRLRAMACGDMRARLLMSVPGVGTIVALTYATAIDGPERFTSSETVSPRSTPSSRHSGRRCWRCGTILIRARAMGARARSYVEEHHTLEQFASCVRAAAEASLRGRPAPESWFEQTAAISSV